MKITRYPIINTKNEIIVSLKVSLDSLGFLTKINNNVSDQKMNKILHPVKNA